MKTPLSPAQLMENSPPYFPVTELKEGMADISTQERKKLLYSLCEVCNIQLNSAAQVQTHYNGKSHLRRVKQLNSTESEPAMSSGSGGPNPHPTTIKSSSTGSSCHSNTLPALVRTPPLMMQSTLDMKPFMSFLWTDHRLFCSYPVFSLIPPVCPLLSFFPCVYSLSISGPVTRCGTSSAVSISNAHCSPDSLPKRK
ncbi:hypothetical protein HF521_016036 [Silurus meridionalis]|uniref:U1-type domain-containing protein n=1 Tax=Silurus meridionalis TaxID=175797 RepID=A0A8T0BUP2_SILME|nr:hypothetical protein HF521_016036 [Silurus meridionalis]